METVTNYAEWVCECPDGDIDLLRELMSYEVQCPHSMKLARDRGILKQTFDMSTLHWSRQTEWPWVIRNAFLEPHHVVLDVGGSWGVLKFALANRCNTVVSIDNLKESVTAAKETVDKLRAYNIRCMEGDVKALDFPDKTFDRVFSVSVFEHFPSGHMHAIDECLRVLKPGGIFLLTLDVRFMGESDNDFYLTSLDAEEIIRTLDIPGTCGKGCTFQIFGGATIGALMMRYVKPR